MKNCWIVMEKSSILNNRVPVAVFMTNNEAIEYGKKRFREGRKGVEIVGPVQFNS